VETIGTYLVNDHARCGALFSEVQQALEDGHWKQTAQAFACYDDALERHLLIEERIVFPAFEKAVHSLATPSMAMRTEHLGIRAIVQRLANAIAERSAAAASAHAAALDQLMRRHQASEAGLLYPMIERVLALRQDSLLAAMRMFGAMDVAARAA